MTAKKKTPTPDVEGTAREAAPMPEAAEAIEDYLPAAGELVLHDPHDEHERFVVLDAHDVKMIVQRAQSSALRKWVYELDGTRDEKGRPVRGLSVDAVQDITQQMNWTGKARLGTIPETLEVERITEDIGNGPEPLWVATIFAVDEVTGARWPGSAMQPVMMQLKASTAKRWREKGKNVPEDNRVFDQFSRTKAIQKATRNALSAFIPEELEQSIIAMFENDPSRVERIRTEAEAKVEEAPPALDTPEAKALIREIEGLYDEIVWPEARVEFTPGTFAAWMRQSQHDMGALERMKTYVAERLEGFRAKYGGES